jgi:hypothetical protein
MKSRGLPGGGRVRASDSRGTLPVTRIRRGPGRCRARCWPGPQPPGGLRQSPGRLPLLSSQAPGLRVALNRRPRLESLAPWHCGRSQAPSHESAATRAQCPAVTEWSHHALPMPRCRVRVTVHNGRPLRLPRPAQAGVSSRASGRRAHLQARAAGGSELKFTPAEAAARAWSPVDSRGIPTIFFFRRTPGGRLL